MRRRLVMPAFGMVVLSVASPIAILRAQEVSLFPNPAYGPTAYDILAVADFDSNGRDDIATAGYALDGTFTSVITVLMARGSLGYEQSSIDPDPTSPVYGTVAGDLDGDGFQDILARRGFPFRFWRYPGNGDGTFETKVDSGLSASYEALRAADMTGDGRLDTVEVYGSAVRVGIANSSGQFVLGPEFSGVGIGNGEPAISDFDLDGNLDVATCSAPFSSVATLLGDGQGSFTAAWRSSVPNGAKGLAAGDLDADGREDLCLGRGDAGVTLLFGQSGGGFATTLGSYSSIATSVALADIDSDGDLDLGCAGGTIGRNDGTGSFQNTGIVTSGSPIVAGHFTDDAGRDFATGAGSVSFFGLDATGSVPPSITQYSQSNAEVVAVADIDTDGDEDIITSSSGSSTLQTLVKVGANSFVPGPSLSTQTGVVDDLLAVDIDSDGDRDLVTSVHTGSHSGSTSTVTLFLSDGIGGFSAPLGVQPSAPYFHAHLAVADIDGDSDPDVIIHGDTYGFQLLRNQSGALATPVAYGVASPVTTRLAAVGDLNGDGRDDLAFSSTNSPQGVAIFAGTSSGVLVGPYYASMPVGFTLAIGDFDGDGKRDLFTGAAVARGNGIGGFFPSQAFSAPFSGSIPGYGIIETLVADLDGDGTDEAIFPTYTFNRIGIVCPATNGWSYVTFPVGTTVRSLAQIDLDGDAFQDLVVTADSTTLSFLTNQAMPAALTHYGVGKAGTDGIPTLDSELPVIGVPLTLRLEHGLPGATPLLFAGFTPAAIPFDQGTLLVSPALSLVLPPFAQNGTIVLPIQLPAGLSLCGVSVYLQAMFVDPLATGLAKTAQTAGLRWSIGW